MKEQFKTIKEKNPNLSSIMCFIKMIIGKRITEFDLRKGFEMVDKDDWKGNNKENIINSIKRKVIIK